MSGTSGYGRLFLAYQYPVKGEDDFIEIATTRPETMLEILWCIRMTRAIRNTSENLYSSADEQRNSGYRRRIY